MMKKVPFEQEKIIEHLNYENEEVEEEEEWNGFNEDTMNSF